MDQSHPASVLVACLSTLVNLHTRAPVTLYERQQEEERWHQDRGAALDRKEESRSCKAWEPKVPTVGEISTMFLKSTRLCEDSQESRSVYIPKVLHVTRSVVMQRAREGIMQLQSIHSALPVTPQLRHKTQLYQLPDMLSHYGIPS
ncbi:hypothetical protein NDU88_009325 [Pleurodeles waltl]|uniref:Uncharacterized protein n=1 Tax=Pleurodeles waltl TaxID=8319 RepID=A0AAV7PUP8_PLEWA|nr:hypothetical protein NDU88_009325 [Pleurodeles waltl]